MACMFSKIITEKEICIVSTETTEGASSIHFISHIQYFRHSIRKHCVSPKVSVLLRLQSKVRRIKLVSGIQVTQLKLVKQAEPQAEIR